MKTYGAILPDGPQSIGFVSMWHRYLEMTVSSDLDAMGRVTLSIDSHNEGDTVNHSAVLTLSDEQEAALLDFLQKRATHEEALQMHNEWRFADKRVRDIEDDVARAKETLRTAENALHWAKTDRAQAVGSHYFREDDLSI